MNFVLCILNQGTIVILSINNPFGTGQFLSQDHVSKTSDANPSPLMHHGVKNICLINRILRHDRQI